ncbi:MAG TPA: division/cell wall cluster transcriptional repressor MraZ [Burkholderiaceae bacterium]|nr:division/cell wall cluster transcriptional repressor MraZ [Burkholderiaceae bacterium]
MSSFVFQGASALALDGKGRITVPVRHRDVLMALAGGQLTITKHPDGCLLIFPRPAWEVFRDKLMGLPFAADGWRRIFLGNAVDVEIDGSSRVLISPELRTAAALSKDVMLLGMGQRLELWDAAKYAEQEAKTVSQGMPEALKDFVL